MLLMLGFPLSTAFAWNPFGPKNFEDCVLQNMKGVTSDAAAAHIRMACIKKFPRQPEQEKSAPTTRYGYPRIDIWDYEYSSKIFENIGLGKTRKNQYGGIEIVVTNKNNFGLTGIYIGTLKNKKSVTCSLDKSDYKEIYECSGNVNPNTTNIIYCRDPVEAWCHVGIKGELQVDLDDFFRKARR